MPKYLITWKSDLSRWPTDPKERGALSVKLLEMVQQGIKEGKMTDWGQFIGGQEGYAIAEGDALDLNFSFRQYYPYVTFKVHQALSVDEISDAIKAMMK